MSLFRVRDWCSSQLGDGTEEFDYGCMCVANLLSDQTKSAGLCFIICSDNVDIGNFYVSSLLEQIAIGSFAGVLRLFDFGSKLPDDAQAAPVSSGRVKPENLLLEKQLDSPIVQLATGYFVSWDDCYSKATDTKTVHSFLFLRGSEKLYLAVLHPRKLVVYSFKGSHFYTYL